jgi:hypothetical protein
VNRTAEVLYFPADEGGPLSPNTHTVAVTHPSLLLTPHNHNLVPWPFSGAWSAAAAAAAAAAASSALLSLGMNEKRALRGNAPL